MAKVTSASLARRAPFVLAIAAALGALSAPVAQGTSGPPACVVRDVTAGTLGHSFADMVGAAASGDHLTVRGRCVGYPVTIRVDLVVRGIGAATLVGHRESTVLRVRKSAVVTLRHLLITSGTRLPTYSRGSAIANLGTLTLEDSAVRSNQIGGIGNGGTMSIVDTVVRGNEWGIGNGGSMSLERVVVRDNGRGSKAGVGILNSGTLTVTDSVIRGNASELFAGGIYNAGTVTVVDSVIRDNTSHRGGGVWSGPGSVVLIGTTVTSNVATSNGGGIYNVQGALSLVDTTVTSNTATAGGGIYNISADGGTVELDGTSSVSGNVPDDCVDTPAC